MENDVSNTIDLVENPITEEADEEAKAMKLFNLEEKKDGKQGKGN